VLVVNDLLGLTSRYVPRFVKQYADLNAIISAAVAQYRQEVRTGAFPGSGQTFQ
jgi:3-methyl-2-oxobutanoate hydroxymethyltransferase